MTNQTAADPARLCVYCGSNAGNSPTYAAIARKLGGAMANRGIGLVYGGGSVGLMGMIADAAMEAGGEVIGVITDQLVNAEVAHRDLARLEVVPTMHDRKARLSELADGFVVLPGGFGTVDEFAEMLTWNQLGIVAKPVVLLDVEGYWEPMLAWMDKAVECGFVRPPHRMLAQRALSVDEAIALALAPVPATPHKWLDRDLTPRGVPRP
ncbi:MAG: TIGR00730 family Rossman fold protein [Actinomycetota bacterium]|nr:TIGR00730 family Rossman fold protein [Actinomycetota bacterium]